jgi:hypothetical protein
MCHRHADSPLLPNGMSRRPVTNVDQAAPGAIPPRHFPVATAIEFTSLDRQKEFEILGLEFLVAGIGEVLPTEEAFVRLGRAVTVVAQVLVVSSPSIDVVKLERRAFDRRAPLFLSPADLLGRDAQGASHVLLCAVLYICTFREIWRSSYVWNWSQHESGSSGTLVFVDDIRCAPESHGWHVTAPLGNGKTGRTGWRLACMADRDGDCPS